AAGKKPSFVGHVERREFSEARILVAENAGERTILHAQSSVLKEPAEGSKTPTPAVQMRKGHLQLGEFAVRHLVWESGPSTPLAGDELCRCAGPVGKAGLHRVFAQDVRTRCLAADHLALERTLS